MTRFMLDDELLDAQALRVVGSAVYGGADVAECRDACGRVMGTDLTSWFESWTDAADAAQAIGEREEASGQVESARNAYLRASNYHRTAGVMLLGAPVDPRLVASQGSQTATFRRFAAMLERPPEIIEIPYEDVTLPGYFFRSGDGRRATVILTGGYDGTAEELYLFNGVAALARGYNVLAFDGPGQGAALIERGMTIRADWEAVITPVVDYLLIRGEVDASRIALIGLSLGAYLAPRAASAEHRLAACIADCGSFDLYASALERMPGLLGGAFARRNRLAIAIVRRILGRLVNDPTGGWALRRGMLVHGATDAVGYLEALREFTLEKRAGAIRCPTWVCNAEGDDISASAPHLVAALTCEKTYVTFTAAEGAGDHCEVGARTLYHDRSFAWLDARLEPTRVLARAP